MTPEQYTTKLKKTFCQATEGFLEKDAIKIDSRPLAYGAFEIVFLHRNLAHKVTVSKMEIIEFSRSGLIEIHISNLIEEAVSRFLSQRLSLKNDYGIQAQLRLER
jgi:hypothetical protein